MNEGGSEYGGGNGSRKTIIRNQHLSPRKSSILSTTSRKQSILQTPTAQMDQISLTPISATCFGDFILAQLISTSRTNYLAIWGPECHNCEAQELTVASAKFCRPLPSVSLTSLSLRVLFQDSTVRFIIHGASNDRIERWVLNGSGEVLETATKSLETSIDNFSVDRTGEIMISYEENFMILRNNELRVFHSIKFGKEIPSHSLIIPQAHTNKLHLIACYESGLVLGWEVPPPQGNTSSELAAYFTQPIFQLKLSTKSSLCGIVEVLNLDRLHHRRLCVVSRAGQLWILEWSTRDVIVCSEVKHVDLKKSLRYQPTNTNTPPQASTPTAALAAAPPTTPRGPASGSRNIREGKQQPTPTSTPSINIDITVLAICSCPDVSFERYTPPGDRPDGIPLDQWRNIQANAVTQTSKFELHFNYKPTICLLTSLGTTVLVDIENFRILPPVSISGVNNSEERINGVIASQISCLNVLNLQRTGRGYQTDENGKIDENENDGDEDEGSSEESDNEEMRGNRSRAGSPSRSIGRKTVVSPLRMGSPGRDSVSDRSLVSPIRRGSVQSRNSIRRGSVSRSQPPQVIADFKTITNLRKIQATKYGSLVTIFAFSVLLGGFDRKIMIRPVFISTTSPPAASTPAISPKKSTERGSKPSQNHVEKTKREISQSPEDIQARVEVARLPLWALTLKEQGSAESLPENKFFDNNQTSDTATMIDPTDAGPRSLFHHPYFNSNSLPEKSPLATNTNSDTAKQPQSARSRTPSKLRGGWEQPLKTQKGELIDQPVTFHSRIKSSGYGVADVSGNRWKQKKQMNNPSSSSSSSNPCRSKSAPRNTAGVTDRTTIASRLRMYPRDCGPLTQHQEYNNYPPPVSNIRQIPILKLNFSNDGMMIGIISAGNDVGTLRTPLGRYKGDGLYYLGHDAQVNSIEFAHKSDLIISSSADATARIWKSGRVDSAVVVFSHKKHQPIKVGGTNPTVGQTTSNRQSNQRNVPFSGAIQCASFYYLDKYALLTSKTSVMMYSYDLDDLEHENDLKRLQATGKYKFIHEWSYNAAQNLTTTACLNSVESPTIISASSDRKILLLDAISGKISRIIDSNHDRGVHCIALPQPSVHVSLPQSNYNIFATSSTDNVISLWDIRSPSIIFRFTEHVNRREKIQCSFSPCLRYLTTGSEDRSVRIIDIQSGGRQINKLTGFHRDVVSTVAYHPIHPQLISGSYDGTIRCFTSSSSSSSSTE